MELLTSSHITQSTPIPAFDIASYSAEYSAESSSQVSFVSQVLSATARAPRMHGPIHETSANPARLGVTILHLILVVVGTINLLIIFVILVRPTIRTITNVYIVSLCLANFIYLINLTLVVATQFNDKSWPFGMTLCHVYHGTETTGKYASVLFVVLLAADRYAVMCQPDFCARYRNYSRAVRLSIGAWIIAIAAASPLYIFSRVGVLVGDEKETYLCIASWPTIASARWYIGLSSVFVFAVPLALIVFCYYNIISKLRNAAKGRMRLANRLGAKRRSPYHKITLLVLWVVVFHVLCWSPFWFFNLLSAIFRLRITTHYDRLLINFIHLLPYFNCALNPIVYAVQAENVRSAFSSLSWRSFRKGARFFDMKDRNQSTYRRTKSQPLLLLVAKPSRDGKEKVKANRKSLSYPPQTPSKHSAVEERSCEVRPPSCAERSPAFLHGMKARNEPCRRSTQTTLLSQGAQLTIQVDSCSRLSDELSLNLYHV